jgi:hypothetical protein
MLSDGVVHPMLFLGEVGKAMLIVPVHHLMQNDQTKDVLSLLPAYLGLLRGGLDFVSLISESWLMNIPAVEREFGKELTENPLFVRGMVSKYGGVSFLPPHLKKEVVTASIDIANDRYFTAWSIHRDASDKPSLAKYDSFELEKTENSSGRLIGMLTRYYKLKAAFDELSVVMKKETGEALTLEFLARTLSKIEKTDAHVNAYALASTLLSSLPPEMGQSTTPSSMQ